MVSVLVYGRFYEIMIVSYDTIKCIQILQKN